MQLLYCCSYKENTYQCYCWCACILAHICSFQFPAISGDTICDCVSGYNGHHPSHHQLVNLHQAAYSQEKCTTCVWLCESSSFSSSTTTTTHSDTQQSCLHSSWADRVRCLHKHSWSQQPKLTDNNYNSYKLIIKTNLFWKNWICSFVYPNPSCSDYSCVILFV